ncbi:RE1, partial [Symbiodinium necroappetens]
RAGLSVRYARMSGPEWAELCELDEEQFEARISRWQRVLGGADEDPSMDSVSASIPHNLLVAHVFQGRNWNRDPELIVNGPAGPVLAARVLDYSDDGPPDETPFPDRMIMFSVHDLVRDVTEMVILRVVLIEEEQEGNGNPLQPVLQVPGPPPPEVRVIQCSDEAGKTSGDRPSRLPVPLPNPTFIQAHPARPLREVPPQEEAMLCKTEATTTKGLEAILEGLSEPLSVMHTAAQEEVRAHLHKWKGAIEKELRSLKEPGVLVSHFGKEAQGLIARPGTTVIPLKGVFTAKAPSGPQDGLYRRKCRLVGCGNQASHVDTDSLYAAGAPAELVRASLVQACRHGWSGFTTDIKSAFTQTPIPQHAAQRYLLRPPRWLVELGLASSDEYYSLGKVLYGFKEAPAWWSDHRDTKLLTASFLGCHLEQGTSDPSLWRIMKGEDLKGFLVTYVDDFLILSDGPTARGLHQWLLEGAGWETDGLSEAKTGEPVRFLGMQLERHKDGHFSLDQESYIDELVRAYALTSSDRSKVVCPKEILMSEPESAPKADEATIKAAQKVAGECLWLSQRNFGDRAKVAVLPAPDEEFQVGQHSYGGHVVELFGAELIQAVEGCMYAESLLTVLQDLRVQCSTVQLLLDNTASIAFIGWEVKHCRGEYQRADLLTKPLPAARMRFLCDLLQLGEGPMPRAAEDQNQVCVCKGEGEGGEDADQGMPIEWSWELAVLTLLVVLSTLFVWEASGAPCRRRRESTPHVRAVSVKERRAKKLQDRVAAAIDSAVSESPTGDEGRPVPRKGRNKCPSEAAEAEPGPSPSPTVVYGGINMSAHSSTCAYG